VKLEARLLEVAVESFFVYDGHVKGLHRSLWAFTKRGLVLWLDVVKTLTPVRITTEGHPLGTKIVDQSVRTKLTRPMLQLYCIPEESLFPRSAE
jgi:hypothetical protein